MATARRAPAGADHDFRQEGRVRPTSATAKPVVVGDAHAPRRNITPLAVTRGASGSDEARQPLFGSICCPSGDLDEHFRRQIARRHRRVTRIRAVQADGDAAVVGCNEKVLIKPVPYFADLVAHPASSSGGKSVMCLLIRSPGTSNGRCYGCLWSFRALHVIPHRAAVASPRMLDWVRPSSIISKRKYLCSCTRTVFNERVGRNM